MKKVNNKSYMLTCRISEDQYKQLKRLQKEHDTITDVVKRLIAYSMYKEGNDKEWQEDIHISRPEQLMQ